MTCERSALISWGRVFSSVRTKHAKFPWAVTKCRYKHNPETNKSTSHCTCHQASDGKWIQRTKLRLEGEKEERREERREERMERKRKEGMNEGRKTRESESKVTF